MTASEEGVGCHGKFVGLIFRTSLVNACNQRAKRVFEWGLIV